MSIPLARNLWRGLRASGAFAASVAAVACNGGAPSQIAPLTLSNATHSLPEFSAAAAVTRSIGARPEQRKTWMDAHAKGPLLYVSDSDLNDVLAYRWPKLQLIGNLSGLSYPQGECIDGSGNIWIANTTKFEMLEFAPRSVNPIKKLRDPGEYPSGCSVSPSGDLAVANIVAKSGTGYGAGSLSIYKSAQGLPKVFSDPSFARVFFDGYDAHGNVFFDGEDASSNFLIAEFNGKTFVPLTVSGATVNAPGSVQVIGGHINVEDQTGSEGNSVMYRTTLKGSTLQVDATAQLVNGMDCVQSYIYGKGADQRVICPDTETPSINVYKYPAGGDPTTALHRNIVAPTGSVVTP